MGIGWVRRIVMIVMGLALLTAACAAPEEAAEESSPGAAAPASEAQGSEPSGAASGEPIRIGANIEQSGPASVQGQAYANALQLLIDQINADGGIIGRPVELLIEDNATDESETITITRGVDGRLDLTATAA